MSSHDYKSAQRPSPDELLVAIADYTKNYQVDSPQAYETARYCLMDTLACGFQALKYPACTRLLGPGGARAPRCPAASRVPGTSYELDPVMGAFSIGAMVRWLDFNDTWLAAEWGHPSDNLGAILALADYLSRRAILLGEKPLTVRDVLTAMIKAHEIQGVLALENSFNRVGLDHVLLVRVASTAVATAMLGGSLEQIVNALSNAWIDGGALRTYRHAPNTGSRKSWAAGDATSRAVRHALFALKRRNGLSVGIERENLGLPGRAVQGQATHARAAARQLRHGKRAVQDQLPGRVPRADRGGVRDGAAPEGQGQARAHRAHRHRNAGTRRAHHRQDRAARESRRSRSLHPVHGGGAADLRPPHRRGLRRRRSPTIRASTCCAAKMEVRENTTFTKEYYERDKRHIGNALQIFFSDGSPKLEMRVDFPVGHRKRRAEGMPLLVQKFEASVAAHFPAKQTEAIKAVFARKDLDAMPVNEFMAALVAN